MVVEDNSVSMVALPIPIVLFIIDIWLGRRQAEKETAH